MRNTSATCAAESRALRWRSLCVVLAGIRRPEQQSFGVVIDWHGNRTTGALRGARRQGTEGARTRREVVLENLATPTRAKLPPPRETDTPSQVRPDDHSRGISHTRPMTNESDLPSDGWSAVAAALRSCASALAELATAMTVLVANRRVERRRSRSAAAMARCRYCVSAKPSEVDGHFLREIVGLTSQETRCKLWTWHPSLVRFFEVLGRPEVSG